MGGDPCEAALPESKSNVIRVVFPPHSLERDRAPTSPLYEH